MKIISKHDYFVIMACKEDDNMKSLINYLCDYLSLNEIDGETIYHHLVEVIFDVYTLEEIKHILKIEIPLLYQYLKVEKLDFMHLIKLFYHQLMLLDIIKMTETTIDGKKAVIQEELYSVYDNNRMVPFSEYNKYLEKGVSKRKNLN